MSHIDKFGYTSLATNSPNGPFQFRPIYISPPKLKTCSWKLVGWKMFQFLLKGESGPFFRGLSFIFGGCIPPNSNFLLRFPTFIFSAGFCWQSWPTWPTSGVPKKQAVKEFCLVDLWWMCVKLCFCYFVALFVSFCFLLLDELSVHSL